MVFKKIGLFLIVSITVAIIVCGHFFTNKTDTELQISDHIRLGFGKEGTVSIPVALIPAEEVPHYQSLLKGKTKAQVTELVDLVRLSISKAIISSTDFLKFMRLADYLTANFSSEAKDLFSLIPPQNNYDVLENAIRTHLAYPGLDFPEGKILRLPITGFSSPEEAETYRVFFEKRLFEESKALVGFAQGFFKEKPIAAPDFLKLMKIADRFETLEQAGKAISAIEEGKRNPDSLAEIFGFDLSCLTLKFPGKGNVDIPVATFKSEEFDMVHNLFRGKTKEKVAPLMDLVKSVLTQKIIPSSAFLKFMQIAFHYETIEEARAAFSRVTSAQIDNNPDTLAAALGLRFSSEGVVQNA